MTYFQLVCAPVCLLIHMGAALIKSRGSAIHTSDCLALSKKNKKNKKSAGVLSGNMTKPAGRVLVSVCVDVSEGDQGVVFGLQNDFVWVQREQAHL